MAKTQVAHQKKDKELAKPAAKFLTAFSQSQVPAVDLTRLKSSGGGFSFGPGGIIEQTDAVIESLAELVRSAAKKLGPVAGHESTVSQIAMNHGHEFVAKKGSVDDAAAALVKAILEEGAATFAYLVPNYLFGLADGIHEIKIGRVRAMRTADYVASRKADYPDEKIEVVPGETFSLTFAPPKVLITMIPICWVIEVNATAENVPEEAKRLIDMAVSYLRLRHPGWGGNYPRIGDREAHPTRPSFHPENGVKFRGPKALAGGVQVPGGYQIDQAVLSVASGAAFVAAAELVFTPSKSSVAERVGRGLVWLTRGRQAADRAERFLFFFTAIEALLSYVRQDSACSSNDRETCRCDSDQRQFRARPNRESD